jgi:copper chaperone
LNNRTIELFNISKSNKLLYFKTNIKCNGCIQTVAPFLSRIKEIKEWKVDLASPDRILTIEGTGLDPKVIISALKQANYKAEQI